MAIRVTYAGSKSGAAYLRISEDDGGHTSMNAASIQVLIAVLEGSVLCVGGSFRPDVPFTAAAWIDVSGIGEANCSDVSRADTLCQPSPADPQAHQSGVERAGETTRVQLDVIDQP
jgi:hypothetical protein